MYLPFLVRKTPIVRVYVSSISNGSILHNSRQQTFTNDNKREEVHPTNISSMYSKVPYITYNITDVKCSTTPTGCTRHKKPKTL